MSIWNGFSVFAQMSITNQQSNSVTATGTGTDLLIPPTGYVKVNGFIKEVGKGGFDVVDGAFLIPADGWYQADGWAAFRHSMNNATIALVFGITPPGGTLTLSPRPTPARNPNVGNLGLIAGGGMFWAAAGTLVDVRIATDVGSPAVITIPNATLRIWQMMTGGR